MECPECGQPVLVEHGAITAHLNPETLQACKAKAKATSSDTPASRPAKKTPTKAKS